MRFPNLSLFPFSKSKEDDDSDYVYASFTARTFAITIDILLLYLILAPVFGWISQMMFPEYYLAGGDGQAQALFQQYITGHISLDVMKDSMRQLGLHNKMGGDYILQFVVSGVLIVFSWVKFNTTPGLHVLRMSVADADTGEAPSLRQYIIRYIVGCISLLPFMAGMILMFFNKRKMSLHDLAANTVILRRKMRWGRKEEVDSESESEEKTEQESQDLRK